MHAEAVTLPGGFGGQATWQRTVWLRPLSGHDELRIAGALAADGRAAGITALLAGSMSLDGGAAAVGAAFARALTVGDREAALLHLRRITLGDRLAAVLTCPACQQKLDLDVSTTALLLPPYSYQTREHETTLVDDTGAFQVRFRLPNGGDQESVASLATRNADAAALEVLRRCVIEVTDHAGRATADIPAGVGRQLPRLMAELDPQAELLLDATCPECGAAFTAPFDAGQFLEREMGLASDELFTEVHVLALHYHWAEAEILAMPRPRRHRYLDLLAESLAGTGGR